ncbi:MAG: TIGR03943 family protein [Mycobacterium sp.]|nr:TIGR03943 family protein [Mycobacterium sp.]
MTRESENTLLLLVGVSLGLICASGAFTRYVKPGQLPWLLGTAAFLMVLALAAIAADLRRGGPASAHDDGHGHRSGSPWLLAVPVVVLIFISPPALRAQPNTPPVSTAADSSSYHHFPPLPAGPAPDVSLPDAVLRAANDTSGSLNGRTVTITGFVLHEPAGVDLGRIVIVCCAADAQLARIHLRGNAAQAASALADNSWVRAVGVVTPAVRRPDQAPIPTLNVTAVHPVDAPANPYAYPR